MKRSLIWRVVLIALLTIGASTVASHAHAYQAPSAPAQSAPSELASSEKSCCGTITEGGQKLLKLLVSMDVEHLWLSHHAVHWRSGFPKEVHGGTHCSAFAAAVADRLGVYILRPPEHSQEFLASAQGRWLAGSHARHDGWVRVESPREAQTLANHGYLVVLVHISPEAEVHGHIAVVRPADKTEQAIDTDGPETIQAGLRNFADGNAQRSFQLHPGVWPSQVGMYAHTTDFSDQTLMGFRQ